MISTSPLRYPGGKARFTPFIQSAFEQSGVKPKLFAEACCGGSGVSLALLELGHVNSIALNDRDPLVASFWRVIFGKTEFPVSDINWLVKQIENATLSIAEWKRQRALRPSSVREAAFKCLYLNRTSFNGILHKAGPIGGWKQENRTLDVRFNTEKLIRRIRALYELRDSVVRVDSVNWRQFCTWITHTEGCYIYLDPPYYHKAEQLYAHLFDSKAHISLRDYLANLDVPWMLSYDDSPEVRALYSSLPNVYGRVIDQTYSAHPIGGASFVGRELFFSNKRLPSVQPRVAHRGMSIVGTLSKVASPGKPLRVPSTPTDPADLAILSD